MILLAISIAPGFVKGAWEKLLSPAPTSLGKRGDKAEGCWYLGQRFLVLADYLAEPLRVYFLPPIPWPSQNAGQTSFARSGKYVFPALRNLLSLLQLQAHR